MRIRTCLWAAAVVIAVGGPVGGCAGYQARRDSIRRCADDLPVHREQEREHLPAFRSLGVNTGKNEQKLVEWACKLDADALLIHGPAQTTKTSAWTGAQKTILVLSGEAILFADSFTSTGGKSAKATVAETRVPPAATIEWSGSREPGLRDATIRRIAIPQVTGDSVDRALAQALSDLMLTHAAQIRGLSVISPSEINAMIGLERQKELLGCEEDLVCVSEIAGALGVDGLLTTSVARAGTIQLVSFKLIDVKRATVLLRRTAKIRGDGAELLIEAFETAVPVMLSSLANTAR